MIQEQELFIIVQVSLEGTDNNHYNSGCITGVALQDREN